MTSQTRVAKDISSSVIIKYKQFTMMQNDDVFCDMINSIQIQNMSKTGAGDCSNVNHSDSGFNSGAEMNADNIFFYEDSCPSLTDCLNTKNDIKDDDEYDNDENLLSSATCERHLQTSPSYDNTSLVVTHQREKEFTQIQVNVGIDEDLKMILEMDPSLMDVTIEKAVEPSSQVVDCPKILGLPPKG